MKQSLPARLLALMLVMLALLSVAQTPAYASDVPRRHLYVVICNYYTIFAEEGKPATPYEVFAREYLGALAASCLPQGVDIDLIWMPMGGDINKPIELDVSSIEDVAAVMRTVEAIEGHPLSGDRNYTLPQLGLSRALADAKSRDERAETAAVLLLTDFRLMPVKWREDLLTAYAENPLPIVAVKLGNEPDPEDKKKLFANAEDMWRQLGASYVTDAQQRLSSDSVLGLSAPDGDAETVSEAIRQTWRALLPSDGARSLRNVSAQLLSGALTLPAAGDSVTHRYLLLSADNPITFPAPENTPTATPQPALDLAPSVPPETATSYAFAADGSSLVVEDFAPGEEPLHVSLNASGEPIFQNVLEISVFPPLAMRYTSLTQDGIPSPAQPGSIMRKKRPFTVCAQVVTEDLSPSARDWEVTAVLTASDAKDQRLRAIRTENGYEATFTEGRSGVFTVQFFAEDSSAQLSLQSDPLPLTLQNEAPTALDSPTYAVTFDSPLEDATALSIPLADIVSDPDGDALAFTVACDGGTLPDWAQLEKDHLVLDLSDARLSAGEYTFRVTARDDDPQPASASFDIAFRAQSLREILRGMTAAGTLTLDGTPVAGDAAQTMLRNGSELRYTVALSGFDPAAVWPDGWQAHVDTLLTRFTCALSLRDEYGHAVMPASVGAERISGDAIEMSPRYNDEAGTIEFNAALTMPEQTGAYSAEASIALHEADGAAIQTWLVPLTKTARVIEVPEVTYTRTVEESLMLQSMFSRDNPPCSVEVPMQTLFRSGAEDLLYLTLHPTSKAMTLAGTRVSLTSEAGDAAHLVPGEAFELDRRTPAGQSPILQFEAAQKGVYTFDLTLANSDGDMSTQPLRFSITVGYANERTFWTAVLASLIALLLLGLALALYRLTRPSFSPQSMVTIVAEAAHGPLAPERTISLGGWRKEGAPLESLLRASGLAMHQDTACGRVLRDIRLYPRRDDGFRLRVLSQNALLYLLVDGAAAKEHKMPLSGGATLRVSADDLWYTFHMHTQPQDAADKRR